MEISQVYMFQRAKEMVLRHEALAFIASGLWKGHEIHYFTGRWVDLGQNGTDRLFTHSH